MKRRKGQRIKCYDGVHTLTRINLTTWCDEIDKERVREQKQLWRKRSCRRCKWNYVNGDELLNCPKVKKVKEGLYDILHNQNDLCDKFKT